MRFLGFFGGLLLIAPGSTPAQEPDRPQQRETPQQIVERERADRALERWTTDTLSGFANEADFRAYLRDLRASARAHRVWWTDAPTVRFAQTASAGQSDVQQPICPTEEPNCLRAPSATELQQRTITVTGSRIRYQPITNNQESGVDEGDIVKQVGRYLLVLQDGRIFSIDTRGGAGQRLVLVDRANVYRDARQLTWYDEMVVHDNRVIVTGYSYGDRMSEIAVFRVGQDGRLRHEGTFRIASQDYYSGDNYSTRIVGDRLILYMPIGLAELDPDEPIRWPTLSRWNGERGESSAASGRQLLDATSVHRPLVTTRNPWLHTISICPLGPVSAGRDLGCRTSGFVAGRGRTLYVSPTSAFLWAYQSALDDDDIDYDEVPLCEPAHRPEPAQMMAATIFRVPVNGAAPTVLGARGGPFDQLGLDASNGQFRGLLGQHSDACRHEKSAPLDYFTVSESRFGRRRIEAPRSAYTAMPDIGSGVIENRFTDDFLVFSGRSDWHSRPGPRDDTGAIGPSRVVVVPIAAPERHSTLSVPHNVIRAERIGDNVVLTGYANSNGLSLSVVRTGNVPKIASTALVPGRYEGEGRSHAFNSLIEDDNSGIMGLPTVLRPEDAGRWWWRSGPSDVSFLTVDREGILSGAGSLRSSRRPDEDRPDFRDDHDNPNGYVCEVSCVNWYGNTRPIFTDGRIFALTGTELIEGRRSDASHYGEQVEEVQRLDLTAVVGSGAAGPPEEPR
jgi:hypothetical protein